jgi:uncharacterized protein YndB with AHSA1/START domain
MRTAYSPAGRFSAALKRGFHQAPVDFDREASAPEGAAVNIDFEYLFGQPVERVFPVMADIERRPEWVALALERTSLTDGPVGAGSRYRATDQYPGRRAEFVHEITAYEPNRLLGESWGGPLPGQMITRFVEDGASTKLIVSMEINPSGNLKFVAPLMKGWLVRALMKDYRKLEESMAPDSG